MRIKQNTKSIIAIAAVLVAVGCAPVMENEVQGDINGAPLVFQAQQANAVVNGNTCSVTISGPFGNEHAAASLALNIEMDYAALKAQAIGSINSFNGMTWFSAQGAAPSWFSGENSSAIVRNVWVDAGCTNCAGSAQQNLVGHFDLHSVTDTALKGFLSIRMGGVLPGWNQDNTIDALFEVMFEVAIENLNEQPSEPAVTETTPDTGEVEPNEPAEQTPSEQPEPSVGQPGPLNANYNVVTLNVNMGIDFASGTVLNKGNYKNSDLYATAGHMFMKLSAGGAIPTKSQPMRWWNNSGGHVQTFSGLDQVPWEYPTDADGSKSLVKAKSGIGFVVRNNLSNSYTRIWIQDAGPNFVTLQYEVVSM